MESTLRVGKTPALAAALRGHWPEYLMEAASLGTFMVAACLFAALLEHPASPVRQALPEAEPRRAPMGLAMGLTAISLIYSPWGQRSGAHLNPSVTLVFWRLGRVPGADALFYALAQFTGAILGVRLADLLLAGLPAYPSVNYVATVPGSAGAFLAFLAEVAISFGMAYVVLRLASHPRLGRFTGLFAGALVAAYLLLEAPISDMSMNPARTPGSALPARTWDTPVAPHIHGVNSGPSRAGRDTLWLYFLAPPLGPRNDANPLPGPAPTPGRTPTPSRTRSALPARPAPGRPSGLPLGTSPPSLASRKTPPVLLSFPGTGFRPGSF